MRTDRFYQGARVSARTDDKTLGELMTIRSKHLHPITEPRIWQAWNELDPTGEGPDNGDYSTAFEHGQWWVTGYDSDDERRSWSVVEASGPGSAYGLSFEEV